MFGCLKERASKKRDCTEGKVETASNFIRELFANVNDMICSDYVEGSDKCDNLGKFHCFKSD